MNKLSAKDIMKVTEVHNRLAACSGLKMGEARIGAVDGEYLVELCCEKPGSSLRDSMLAWRSGWAHRVLGKGKTPTQAIQSIEAQIEARSTRH